MEKLKLLIEKLQKEGVPLIFIKDPVHKTPSVSLTLLIVSFTLTVFSLINKFAKIVDGVDIDNSLELLIICGSLYFGRSISKKTKK